MSLYEKVHRQGFPEIRASRTIGPDEARDRFDRYIKSSQRNARIGVYKSDYPDDWYNYHRYLPEHGGSWPSEWGAAPNAGGHGRYRVYTRGSRYSRRRGDRVLLIDRPSSRRRYGRRRPSRKPLRRRKPMKKRVLRRRPRRQNISTMLRKKYIADAIAAGVPRLEVVNQFGDAAMDAYDDIESAKRPRTEVEEDLTQVL